MEYIFYSIAYISGYIITLLLSLSVLCGLYYVSDLAEEHPSVALKILRYTLFFIVGLHFLVLVDGLPVFEVSIGIFSHLFYNSLFRHFPFIKVLSAKVLISSFLFLLSNIVWIHFFLRSNFDILAVLGFLFAFVWLVPLGFFVSLSVGDNGFPDTRSTHANDKHGNIFKTGFDIFLELFNKTGALTSIMFRTKKKA